MERSDAETERERWIVRAMSPSWRRFGLEVAFSCCTKVVQHSVENKVSLGRRLCRRRRELKGLCGGKGDLVEY